MFRPALPIAALCLLAACGTDDVQPLVGDDGGVRADAGATADAGPTSDAGPIADAGVRIPENHRPIEIVCDDIRSTSEPTDLPDPNPGPPFVNCTTHAECTAGDNGRCVGNGRDGWNCTYDECFQDSDCNHVCACAGGFRSDHNVCLPNGNCNVDADCGANGFCSPTLGSCGDFTPWVAYFCHTPEDGCIDDRDCGDYPNYCAYDAVGGKWTCQDSQCAG